MSNYATRVTLSVPRRPAVLFVGHDFAVREVVALPWNSLHEVADYLRFNGLTVSDDPEARMPECWAGRADGEELSGDELGRLKALVPEAFLGVRERERAAILDLPGSFEWKRATADLVLGRDQR